MLLNGSNIHTVLVFMVYTGFVWAWDGWSVHGSSMTQVHLTQITFNITTASASKMSCLVLAETSKVQSKHMSFFRGIRLVMGHGPYAKLVMGFLFTSLAFMVSVWPALQEVFVFVGFGSATFLASFLGQKPQTTMATLSYLWLVFYFIRICK